MRRFVLFGATVLLPCLMLAAIGFIIIRQDRELTSRHAEDRRRAAEAEWRGRRLAQLEQMKRSALEDYFAGRRVRIDFAEGGSETALVSVNDPVHVTNPAISPDGKTLAYLQESKDASTLMAMPISGGEPRVIHRFERMNGGARFNTLSWTPDQKHLLFVTEENKRSDLVLIPSGGGTPRRVGVTLPGAIKAPQMHPSGRAVFFSLIRTDDNQAWVLENFLPAKLASR